MTGPMIPQNGQGGQTGPFGVPLGPNGQPQVFAPNGQQGQQQQQQPAPQFNIPAPQVFQDQRHFIPQNALPQQQQPAPQQFQQQGQPGQFQQQMPAPQGMSDQTILSGPAIPPELQGRSWGEAKQIYSGLRDVVLRSAQQVPQSALTQQQAPLHSPAPAQGAPNNINGQAPLAGNGQDFWRNPAEAIDRAIATRLDQALAPVVQRTQLEAAQSAQQIVASEFPDFAAYAPAVLTSLQQADPRLLGNAELWRTAYFVAKGRAQAFSGLNGAGGNPGGQQGQPQQPFVGGQQAPQGYFQPQQALPGQQPVPNMNSFFTEQPGRQGPSQQGVQLNDAQRFAADKMGMTHADYAAWLGGMGRQIPGVPQGGR
jgi:hypothetical protein